MKKPIITQHPNAISVLLDNRRITIGVMESDAENEPMVVMEFRIADGKKELRTREYDRLGVHFTQVVFSKNAARWIRSILSSLEVKKIL